MTERARSDIPDIQPLSLADLRTALQLGMRDFRRAPGWGLFFGGVYVGIEVNPADIRIDTYRSSGAGGQHVNTTDSAVRITHAPTGIVVTSSEKSQHQNRDIAMKALKSRLYQIELDKRSALVNEAHETAGDAGWGNQIRSYVLQPYQMVKDLRTNFETSDAAGVLDGDLDGLMAATLALDVSGKSRAEATAED